jgi:hypothetical protein
MPRIRTIDPHFPRTPNLSRVSREARLFFILLWTLADDSGRLRLDHERLKDQLYPFDDDAPSLLPLWIGELESARCIELYRVDDVEYLRVRKWRQMQVIQRPSRSRLPMGPQESQESPEESPRVQTPRASQAIPPEEAFFEEGAELPGTPGEFTPERVLDILEIALRKSLATDAQTATARYIELAGRKAGLWGGNGAPTGRKESSATPESGAPPGA